MLEAGGFSATRAGPGIRDVASQGLFRYIFNQHCFRIWRSIRIPPRYT